MCLPLQLYMYLEVLLLRPDLDSAQDSVKVSQGIQLKNKLTKLLHVDCSSRVGKFLLVRTWATIRI